MKVTKQLTKNVTEKQVEVENENEIHCSCTELDRYPMSTS